MAREVLRCDLALVQAVVAESKRRMSFDQLVTLCSRQSAPLAQTRVNSGHQCPPMTSKFLDLELIQDSDLLAEIAAEMVSVGRVLICEGCRDVEALITGFLVFESREQAWPLCGDCISLLSPLHIMV
jgi:hypothetical protein